MHRERDPGDCPHATGWLDPHTRVAECFSCGLPWQETNPKEVHILVADAETRAQKIARLQHEIELRQAELHLLTAGEPMQIVAMPVK